MFVFKPPDRITNQSFKLGDLSDLTHRRGLSVLYHIGDLSEHYLTERDGYRVIVEIEGDVLHLTASRGQFKGILSVVIGQDRLFNGIDATGGFYSLTVNSSSKSQLAEWAEQFGKTVAGFCFFFGAGFTMLIILMIIPIISSVFIVFAGFIGASIGAFVADAILGIALLVVSKCRAFAESQDDWDAFLAEVNATSFKDFTRL